MMALYILSAIAAVTAIMIYIPIDVSFSLSYYENKGVVSLGIRYFFIKIGILPKSDKAEKPEKEKPKKEKQPKEKKTKEKTDTRYLISFARAVIDEVWEDITGFIKHFFTHTLSTKRFAVRAELGAGDPMYTGIAYGAASAFLYNLVSFIGTHSKLGEWEIALSPDFEKAGASGEADIVIRTRIAYVLKLAAKAVAIGIKILLINRRVKKNG